MGIVLVAGDCSPRRSLPHLSVCLGQDELIMTYECRLREALDQDRRLAAAVVTSQRRQLTAGQLTAECDRLRAELERLRADHETQLRESEHNYQQGLASYRQLIENNVSRPDWWSPRHR